jgi:hypothetical protein
MCTNLIKEHCAHLLLRLPHEFALLLALLPPFFPFIPQNIFNFCLPTFELLVEKQNFQIAEVVKATVVFPSNRSI